MTHFPRRPSRPAALATGATAPTTSGAVRDVLWGRPIFKAPQLNPRVALDPLPFTATRAPRPRSGRA